jgi:hypothetical protein
MDTKKLSGVVTWAEIGDLATSETDRVILRNNDELIVECRYESRLYSLLLKRGGDNYFSGSCEVSDKKERWKVDASARLYSYGTAHVLVGSWKEDGNHHWVVELEEIAHFADEHANKA